MALGHGISQHRLVFLLLLQSLELNQLSRQAGVPGPVEVRDPPWNERRPLFWR